MALPRSRNTTYGSSDPIKATDLDEFQDCIIAGAHGDIVENYHLGGSALAGAAVNGSGQVETSGVAVVSFYGILATVGDVLTGATFQAKGNPAATGDITVAKVWRNQVDGTLDSLGDTPVNNLPNSWAAYPITFTAPVTVAAGDSFWVEFGINAANVVLSTLGLAKYHPLP